MTEMVLRVRLVSGDQLDVTFEADGDEDEVIEPSRQDSRRRLWRASHQPW